MLDCCSNTAIAATTTIPFCMGATPSAVNTRRRQRTTSARAVGRPR